MTRRPRAALLALLACAALLAGASLVGGCVYYNGMYNTNRLARSARKAERDGRVFEANSLWGQVITRAESLVVRHPRSKYADRANVLRGLALARLDQCEAAIGPLGRVSLIEPDGDLAEESALALGRCQLEQGDAALADLAFARVIDSRDSARRAEARFRHAQALRMTGRYRDALAIMRGSPDPRGRSDLLLALAGSGQTDQALALADSLLAINDTTFAWDSVVVALGQQDPRVASALVSRLGRDPRATPELRARRLYEDALRLADVDTARAVARLSEAAGAGGRTESGARARLTLLQLAVSGARTLEELGPLGDSLTALAARGSGAASDASLLQLSVARLRPLADSAKPNVPRGDLRLFLGAEDARDELRAPFLAARLFRRLVEEWPASPYAPKALLAAERLDPTMGDAGRVALDSVYAGSPYLAALRGEDAPGYRALEDSLEAFAAAQTLAGPRRQKPGARSPPREDTEPDPIARRRARERERVEEGARPRRGVEP